MVTGRFTQSIQKIAGRLDTPIICVAGAKSGLEVAVDVKIGPKYFEFKKSAEVIFDKEVKRILRDG